MPPTNQRPPRKLAKTSARGYGWKHQTLRTQWAPRIKTGKVQCWRCGHKIHPNAPWDLGHDDHNRNKYRGPEHRKCNRGARPHTQQRTAPSRPTALEFFRTR